DPAPQPSAARKERVPAEDERADAGHRHRRAEELEPGRHRRSASATSATRFRYPEVVASMTSRRSLGQKPKTTRQAQRTTGAAHSVRRGSERCAWSPTGRGPQKMIFEARST